MDQEGVVPSRDSLRGAAPPHQYAGQAAGGRFPHHKTVGIEGGGEKEHIGSGIPASELFTVPDRTDEEAFAAEIELRYVSSDVRFVGAGAYEHHPVVDVLVMKGLQGVQYQPYALVPHETPDEEEYRNIPWEVMLSGDGGDVTLRRSPYGYIHSVFHDHPVPLVSQGADVLSGAVGHHPQLIAGADGFHQCVDCTLLEDPAPHGVGDVHVELRMVCQNQRHVHPGAKLPCHDVAHDGAVAVQEGYVPSGDPVLG